MGNQTEYNDGDRVFVIDDSFDPVIQQGTVALQFKDYNTIPVVFETDPYDSEKSNSRRVDVLPLQCVSVDADPYEIDQLLGL